MPDSKIMPRSQDYIKTICYSAYCLIFTHSFRHVKFSCPCNYPFFFLDVYFLPFFLQFWCSFFYFFLVWKICCAEKSKPCLRQQKIYFGQNFYVPNKSICFGEEGVPRSKNLKHDFELTGDPKCDPSGPKNRK